jgi:hypothetical protein
MVDVTLQLGFQSEGNGIQAIPSEEPDWILSSGKDRGEEAPDALVTDEVRRAK